MTEKRFHWDWKTGRMKDTYSDFQATKDMRLIEQSINDACRSYEKEIAKLKEENEQLRNKIKHYDEVWVNQLKEELRSIESRLRFIHPVLSHDPVLTRCTAPFFSEKTALLERRIEIKKILKEFDLE